MCGVHIVYTKLRMGTGYYVYLPARRIIVEAINHGTVAVHQNRPAISILLARLHPDTEQEHHAPVPAIIQGGVEFGAGPLKERGRGNEEDKIHPHLLVVAPERPAVDKLCAQKVLVPDIKAAEYQGVCARYQGVCALLQILHWRVSAKLPLVFLLLDPS